MDRALQRRARDPLPLPCLMVQKGRGPRVLFGSNHPLRGQPRKLDLNDLRAARIKSMSFCSDAQVSTMGCTDGAISCATLCQPAAAPTDQIPGTAGEQEGEKQKRVTD